jgi:predicted RNase H-like HicB family nuclease
MLTYRFDLQEGDKGVILSFPDLPEAVMVAASRIDAIAGALALLESCLDDYVANGRPIPPPRPRPGELMITTARFTLDGRVRRRRAEAE